MVSKDSEVKVSKLAKDRDIAMDFAEKIYKKVGASIKSIVLFGSAAKGIAGPKSDIDIVIIIDDSTISWDDELIAWYREELRKIIAQSRYAKTLHVNTVRLTTWWNEMIRGEPVVINIIRWGDPLIDFGGFFTPLKTLLAQGHIKTTPEMIFVTLGRAPAHLMRCKASMVTALESVYWAFVDASHAALIAAKVSPPSPEHIPSAMRQHLVDTGLLKSEYVNWYRDLYIMVHKVIRGESGDIDGKEIQMWRDRSDRYLREMASVVKKLTGI